MEYALPPNSEPQVASDGGGFHVTFLINADGMILIVDPHCSGQSPFFQTISEARTFQEIVGVEAASDLLYRCVTYGFAAMELRAGVKMVRCFLHENETNKDITCTLICS